MHQLFGRRVDRLLRATATGAGQARRGAEQAADHRPLLVHRAAARPQVHAVQALQRGILFGLGLARQAGHFLGRGGDRATAIMAAGLALERGDEFAQEVDLVAVAGHDRRQNDECAWIISPIAGWADATCPAIDQLPILPL